jgi:hypothetical protein
VGWYRVGCIGIDDHGNLQKKRGRLMSTPFTVSTRGWMLSSPVSHVPFDAVVSLDFNEGTFNRDAILSNASIVHKVKDDFAARQILESFTDRLARDLFVDTSKDTQRIVQGSSGNPNGTRYTPDTRQFNARHVFIMKGLEQGKFHADSLTLATVYDLDAANASQVRTLWGKPLRTCVGG